VYLGTAHDEGIVVSGKRHREHIDVHDEDAKHGDPAQGIETQIAIGRVDRAGFSGGELARITH
jgi:hypothetical protein